MQLTVEIHGGENPGDLVAEVTNVRIDGKAIVEELKTLYFLKKFEQIVVHTSPQSTIPPLL